MGIPRKAKNELKNRENRFVAWAKKIRDKCLSFLVYAKIIIIIPCIFSLKNGFGHVDPFNKADLEVNK